MGNITKKKIVNSLSWSFAEKIMTDVVEALISIILARLLLPNDYGTVSLVQIFVTITSIFVNTGMSTSLIQRKDADDEQISTIFYLNALLGLFLYAVLFMLAPYLSSIKGGSDELTLIIRVLAIKVPVASIYSIQHAYIKKQMKFKLFFYSSSIGTFMAGVVGVVLAYKGFGPWALIFSTLTDQVLDCVILFFTSKWFPKFKIKIKKTWPIIKFGLQILVTELISRVYGQLRSLLQGVKYSPADLAYDVKGQKIPNMIINTIDPSVTRVMLPVLSEKQDDKLALKNTVRTSIRIYSFFLCPVMVGIALTADKFIPLVFSSNWSMCVPFIQAYCVARIVGTMVTYDDKIVQACGAGKVLIKINVLVMVVDIAIVICAIALINSPIALAVSSVFTSLITTFIYSYETDKLVGYSYLEHLKDYCPQMIVALLMGVAVYVGGLFFNNILVCLIIQMLIGGTSYFILSMLFRLKPALYVIDKIRNKK